MYYLTTSVPFIVFLRADLSPYEKEILDERLENTHMDIDELVFRKTSSEFLLKIFIFFLININIFFLMCIVSQKYPGK